MSNGMELIYQQTKRSQKVKHARMPSKQQQSQAARTREHATVS